MLSAIKVNAQINNHPLFDLPFSGRFREDSGDTMLNFVFGSDGLFLAG